MNTNKGVKAGSPEEITSGILHVCLPFVWHQKKEIGEEPDEVFVTNTKKEAAVK